MSSTHQVEGSEHVLKTPIWITVIRGFQFLISLIIVGLAGRMMHDAYMDEHGLALATVSSPLLVSFFFQLLTLYSL